VPNQVAPFRRLKGIGTANDWFDTSAFVQPTGISLGNMGQNVYSGPGLLSFDSTLKRSFPIHENISIDFRMQAFNALNHPVFANPSTTLGGTSLLGTGGSRERGNLGIDVNGEATSGHFRGFHSHQLAPDATGIAKLRNTHIIGSQNEQT